MIRVASIFSLSVALLGGCAAEIDQTSVPPGSAPSAIIDGTPHDGDPATLFVLTEGHRSCTGALIAPRAVLTARHCIEDVDTGRRARAQDIEVFQGRFGGENQYARVVDYETTEGRIIPLDDPSVDVAVLILDGPGNARPYGIVRDRAELRGQRITGIGYGVTDDGRSGEKYRGTSTVDMIGQNSFTTAGPLACFGDSGGPAILADGRIAGVAHGVWGERAYRRDQADVACQISMYVRTDAFIELIDRAVARAGGYEQAPAPTPPTTDGGAPLYPDGGIPLPNDAGWFYPPVADASTSRPNDGGLSPVPPPQGPPTGPKPSDSTSGEPTYGTERLSPGFTPAVRTLRGLAGGNISASNVGAGCAGFIANSPDHVLELERDFAYVRILVNGGDNDTSLMIRTPSGEFACADDSDGSHPILAGAASAGSYRVWIGSHVRGATPAYTLGVTEGSGIWVRDVR